VYPIGPTLDLIGWWRGESNALNSVGSNNATVVGQTYPDGYIGKCFECVGTSKSVSIELVYYSTQEYFEIEFTAKNISGRCDCGIDNVQGDALFVKFNNDVVSIGTSLGDTYPVEGINGYAWNNFKFVTLTWATWFVYINNVLVDIELSFSWTTMYTNILSMPLTPLSDSNLLVDEIKISQKYARGINATVINGSVGLDELKIWNGINT
jgi:hypothetical protein